MSWPKNWEIKLTLNECYCSSFAKANESITKYPFVKNIAKSGFYYLQAYFPWKCLITIRIQLQFIQHVHNIAHKQWAHVVECAWNETIFGS